MADTRRGGIVGGAIAAALVLAVPLVQRWEGLVTTPHKDLVGTPDGCYGDTTVERRNYTADECSVLLVSRLAHDFAPQVIKCVPAIADKPNPLAASISLSYNIGVGAFCKSTAAKRFNAGNWKGGCDAFLLFDRAGGRVIPGLKRRREAERSLCLK